MELPIAISTLSSTVSIYDKLKPEPAAVVRPTGRLPCNIVRPIYLDGDIDGLTDSDLQSIVKHNEVVARLCP